MWNISSAEMCYMLPTSSSAGMKHDIWATVKCYYRKLFAAKLCPASKNIRVRRSGAVLGRVDFG